MLAWTFGEIKVDSERDFPNRGLHADSPRTLSFFESARAMLRGTAYESARAILRGSAYLFVSVYEAASRSSCIVPLAILVRQWERLGGGGVVVSLTNRTRRSAVFG